MGPGSTLVVNVISTVVACNGRNPSDFPPTHPPAPVLWLLSCLCPAPFHGSSPVSGQTSHLMSVLPTEQRAWAAALLSRSPDQLLNSSSQSLIEVKEMLSFLTDKQGSKISSTLRFPPTLKSTFTFVRCCFLPQCTHLHIPLPLAPLLPGPARAFGMGPPTACTHHKQQLLHTLGHHIVKVAKVEVQGRPAHQLLLAQRAPVLGLHCMLGECVSPHLVRLWAQEATVWTAVYLRAHGGWRGYQGRVGPTIPQPVRSWAQHNAPLPI